MTYELTNAATRVLRRIVPSTPRLTHNRLFKILVNGVDAIPRAFWPELRRLPPNHLRIRVGVGNRLFTNQLYYLLHAESFWLYVMTEGLCNMKSNIVDIGCGCGRFAHHLSTFKFREAHFSGFYTGIDIDDEMLNWCRANFDAPRFRFAQATHSSKAYKKSGESSYYALPLRDGEADFVFSNSLFSHLLEGEVENYCQESFRILRKGGWMAMSCFCTDYPPHTIGARHTFRFPVGNAKVESMAVPEAAVAYESQFLMALARRSGFSSAEVRHAPGDFQPLLMCQK